MGLQETCVLHRILLLHPGSASLGIDHARVNGTQPPFTDNASPEDTGDGAGDIQHGRGLRRRESTAIQEQIHSLGYGAPDLSDAVQRRLARYVRAG